MFRNLHVINVTIKTTSTVVKIPPKKLPTSERDESAAEQSAPEVSECNMEISLKSYVQSLCYNLIIIIYIISDL